MKYFTKEIWAGTNGRGKYNRDEAHEMWKHNLKEYTRHVRALKPCEGTVARYIAKKAEGGWAVAFGRLNESVTGSS